MEFGEFNRGIFVVNVLGIIYDKETKKILICKRINDPYINRLSWCFPGGRPGYSEDLEDYLTLKIKKKTNLDVNIEKTIFAKTYPEDRRLLSIYYHCGYKGGEIKLSEKFIEYKWVEPREIKKYFTTSMHPKVLDYLDKLN